MTTSTTRPTVLATPRARTGMVRVTGPGLAACAAGVFGAWAVHALAGAIPLLTAALLLGVIAVNAGLLPEVTRAGTRYAASTLMRAGVALLGLRVALRDIAGLGWPTIAMTVGVLLATLFGTWWLGRRLRLSARMSLLVAAGFAICGASAVAAMEAALGPREPGRTAGDANRHGRASARPAEGAARLQESGGAPARLRESCRADARQGAGAVGVREPVPGRAGVRRGGGEQETATAVALVTLCGTLTIGVLPAVGHLLGLSAYDQGRWIGSSVHDVGQVVATATVVGPAALVPAVAVKLIRVAMLAPVTAVIAVRSRRSERSAAKRPPVLPVFLVAFLALVAVRSTGVVPPDVLAAADTAKDLLFATALFGLGAAVRLRPLLRTGHRALLLGLASWVLVAGIAYAGVLLTR